MNPDRLHDIVEPTAVSWLPQTAGWLVLAVLLVGVAAWWAWKRYEAWRNAAYRRAALEVLAELRAGGTTALPSLPALVKRVAISASDRRSVAALSGRAWLEYLDRSYVGAAFTEGPGRLLPELAYASRETIGGIGQADVDGLFALLEDWIRTHRVPDAGVGETGRA